MGDMHTGMADDQISLQAKGGGSWAKHSERAETGLCTFIVTHALVYHL